MELETKGRSIVSSNSVHLPPSATVITMETMPKRLKDSDDIAMLLGDPGLFQTIQFILLCSQFIPLAMSDLVPIFYSINPKWLQYGTLESRNNTTSAGTFDHRNLTMYFQTALQCDSHGFDLDNTDFQFEYEFSRQRSVVGDMNLICGRTWMIGFSTTLYYLGQIVASPVSGWLADSYGRRPLLLWSNALYTILSIGLIFSGDYVTFTVLRFLIGVVRQAMNTSFYVLMMEGIPPKRRVSWSAMAQFSFSAGVLSLALFAYLLQNWHHIQIALALSNCFAVGFIWFAPESLKWLLFRNRTAEAKAVFSKIAKFNGISIPAETLDDLKNLSEHMSTQRLQAKTYSVLDCFKTFHIRNFTLLCCFIWVAILVQYFGMTLLLSHTYGDVYQNFAISAALELIPRVVGLLLTYKMDNRTTMMSYFLVGGSFAIVAGCIPGGNAVLKTVLSLLARMSVVGCFALAYTFTSELFPIAIRNSGFGLCSIAMRVGSMIAPQIVGLGSATSFQGLPFVLIGSISIMGALATACLPETKGIKMVATVEEAEKLGDLYSWMGRLRRISFGKLSFLPVKFKKSDSTARITDD